MNAFKEQVRRDIDTVILNPDELGEAHEVAGKTATVILDTYRLSEMKQKTQYADAIYRASLLLFIRPGDLGYRPAQDSALTVDGKVYRVREVSGEMLYRIILEVAE